MPATAPTTAAMPSPPQMVTAGASAAQWCSRATQNVTAVPMVTPDPPNRGDVLVEADRYPSHTPCLLRTRVMLGTTETRTQGTLLSSAAGRDLHGTAAAPGPVTEQDE